MNDNDILYKKSLLKGFGLNEDNFQQLEAIAGKEEILDFLQRHQEEAETYGTGDNFSGVKDKSFQANFHIHTTNSDGLMSVERLLELGAQYADALAAKRPGQKFYLAITDHNTANGTIEALKLVLKNPDKYKNLKIALGVEASAIFSSPNAGTASEVHLLSYGLNPFEDTIALINKKRLQLFQYYIKNALNNANIRYIDTISKYGIEFNFDDMAKIRPSIKTCPSNVRYSMKDYLQFRLLYADLVERNPQVNAILRQNGVSATELDFAVPKTMIYENRFAPYWRNYVEQTRLYLEQKMLEKNKYADFSRFREVFGSVSPELANLVNSFEAAALDPKSDMYIREPKPLSFEEVTTSFAQSKYAVSGIAHGALYERNNPKRNLFLQDLYCSFRQRLGNGALIGEKHYPYPPELDTHLTDGMIKLYHYIPSGGLDSHKNNFFTPQTSFDKTFLNEIIGKTTTPFSSLLYKSGSGRI